MSSGMAHVNGITQFTCHPLCLFVCVSVSLEHCWILQNGYIDRDVVWRADSSGPKKPLLYGGNTLYLAIEFDWTSRTRRQPRCVLVKNYTDHLLLDCVVHRDVPVRHFDDPAGARSNATRRCLWHHLLSNAGFLQVTLVSGYCITSIGTRSRNFILATFIR